MFDSGAVQEVEFEADEIDVFSELGINSNTKQNDTFNDPLMSLIETEDDDSSVNETEEIVEVEALEIPEVEPVAIEEQSESKFERLDSRLKAGFLKEIISQKLEDKSDNNTNPITTAPRKMSLVKDSLIVSLHGNVARMEITLEDETGALLKPQSIIDISTGNPMPSSMASKLPISYRPMARNLNALLWDSHCALKQLLSN